MEVNIIEDRDKEDFTKTIEKEIKEGWNPIWETYRRTEIYSIMMVRIKE